MRFQECPASKICNKCKKEKYLTDFHKRRNGLALSCKDCVKAYQIEYRANNKALINEKAAVYRENNRDTLAKRSREWYKNTDKEVVRSRMKAYNSQNKERAKELNSKWNLNNIDRKRAIGRKAYRTNPESYCKNTLLRRRLLKQAIPKWYDSNIVNSIYKSAMELSELTGIKFHVDHIVPINNPKVCGLHTQENLRIITSTENLAKGNKF